MKLHTFAGIRNTILIPLLLFVLLPSLLKAGAVQSYEEAKQLEESGEMEAAFKAFLVTAEESEREGLPRYAFSSYYNAAYLAHRLNKNKELVKIAERAIDIADKDQNRRYFRNSSEQGNIIEMVGMAERGSAQLARIGQGWKFNRSAIKRLRETAGISTEEPGLSIQAISKYPVMLRSLGWRLVEREAFYLHESCRTVSAVALLEESVAAASRDFRSDDHLLRLYSVKCLGELAVIYGFLGYKEKAIELYEKELALAEEKNDLRNALRIRMNILSEKALLTGIDDKLSDEADDILEAYIDAGFRDSGGMKRLYAVVKASHMTYEEHLKLLLDSATESQMVENRVEEFYAQRNELFARASNGEAGLDEEFDDFLLRSRAQGNFRAEPRIHRRYGDWLLGQERYSEAISCYQRAMEKTKAAQWENHVILLYAKLCFAFMKDGQFKQSERYWAEAQAYLKSHPGIPAETVLSASRLRLLCLLHFGRLSEANDFIEECQEFGRSNEVAPMHLTAFTKEFIEGILARLEKEDPLENQNVVSTPMVHPKFLRSVGVPGSPLRGAVFVSNPGSSEAEGFLRLDGGRGRVHTENGQVSVYLVDDDSIPELEIPLTLGGGMLEKLYVTAEPALEKGEISLSWEPAEASEERAMRWEFSREGDNVSKGIIEAASQQFSPFVGLPVEHHLLRPDGEDHPVGVRVRADSALRVEYRHPWDGSLLAVDDNGNGNFTDTGDFWNVVENSELGIEAPFFVRPFEGDPESIEIWYFPKKSSVWETLNLRVEIFDGSDWELHAIDQIEAK